MNKISHIFLWLCATIMMVSCSQELTVIDNSFEFVAEVTYDDSADAHRLTLTRKSGAKDNQYNIAFTIDGEANMSLIDMNGMTHEGSFKETFDDVSSRTYTLSRVAPGEHTLNIDISTEEFSQSLSIDYLVENFSFRFEAGVSYDKTSRTHSLLVTLKEGSESDRYTVVYSIDQDKTTRTYEDTFTKDAPRTYVLSELSPGEHTVHLRISTPKHYQELEVHVSLTQETFRFEGTVLYDEESNSHSLQVKLIEGRTDDVYTVSYGIDNDKTAMTVDEVFTSGIPRTYPLESKPAGEHTIHLKISTPRYSQSLDIPYTIAQDTFVFEGEVIYDKESDAHTLHVKMIEGRSDNVYTVSFLMDDSKTGMTTDEVFAKGITKTYSLGKIPVGDHIIHLTISTAQYSQTLDILFSVAQETFLFDCTVVHNEEEDSHSLRLELKDGRASNRYQVSYWLDNETDKLKSEDVFSTGVPRFYSIPKRQYGEHVLHVEISAAGYTQSADIPYTIAQETFLFEGKVVYDEDKDLHHLSLELKEGKSDTRYRVAYKVDNQNEAIKSEDVFDIGFSRIYELPVMDSGEHTVHVEISNDDYTQTADIPYTIMEQSFRFVSSILFDEETKTHSLRIELKEGRDDISYTVSFMVDNQEPRRTFDELFLDDKVRVYELPAKDPGLHAVNLKITTAKWSQATDLPYTVEDYSFDIDAELEYDASKLTHCLFLTLVKGSRDAVYTVSYKVDGGHSVKLTSAQGKELGSSFQESFKEAVVHSYTLARAAKGRHTFSLTISTDDYLQEIELPYEVEAIPYSVHSEISTSGEDTSSLMLSLTEGDSAAPYYVTVLIDGKELEGASSAKVDFSKTPIKVFEFPVLRPGKHEVSLEVTDGFTKKNSTLSFSEPVRHPFLDITLVHDNTGGYHVAEFGSNPYGITVSIDASLAITGKSTYWMDGGIIYNDSPRESEYLKTVMKTLRDETHISSGYSSRSVNIINRDALAKKMTTSFETSYIWQGFSDDSGEGGVYYMTTGSKPSYYQITDEKFKIDISAEKVSGVTLRITNRIGTMMLNGRSNSSGTLSIAL